LQEYATPDSIEIRFTDATQNVAVMATEKALGQILLNLGSNAVKFSPSGAAVDITLSTDQRANWLHPLRG
jgi:signal transduction histidine kinase